MADESLPNNKAIEALAAHVTELEVANASSNVLVTARLELLKQIRKCHVRLPLLVVTHGQALIKEYESRGSSPFDFLTSLFGGASASLKSEIWSVYEQVCVAAIDASLPTLRNACIVALERRFPSSSRVFTLRGLVYDGADRWEEAKSWYARAASHDTSAMAPRRRRVAHLRMQGRFADAVSELVAHTNLYGEDAAAWSELADLYTAAHRLPQAKYALEELLLIRPENWTISVRYADVLYTLGGADNVATALAYYASALELHPAAARAALGLALCVRALHGSSAVQEHGHHDALRLLARTRLADAASAAGLAAPAAERLLALCDPPSAAAAAAAAAATAVAATTGKAAPQGAKPSAGSVLSSSGAADVDQPE
jgi:tetratricopeptide (TPR) repeat protein